GTRGWDPLTTMYGMPLGAPFQVVPKSGCRLRMPQLAMSVAEFGSTGALAMLVFQGLSFGNGRRPSSDAPGPSPGPVVAGGPAGDSHARARSRSPAREAVRNRRS